jgi:hypothetical protein
MPFKPNYGQQRMERDRAKRAKKEEKLRIQQEEVARRKGEADSPEPADKPEEK